ncbi:hypothetical protein Hanom_Chr10g00887501 [Helianthus anomalus]
MSCLRDFFPLLCQITTIEPEHKIHKIKLHKKSSNFTNPITNSTNGSTFKVAAI